MSSEISGGEEADGPGKKSAEENGEATGEAPGGEVTLSEIERRELQKDTEIDDKMKALLREERVLFVKKFELFEFQTHIREWIEEAVKPII